jgi:hypothetical protein
MMNKNFRNSWRHLVVGLVIALVLLFAGMELNNVVAIVLVAMVILEVLQYFGVVKFWAYFVPYFCKPQVQEYSKSKKADSVLDVVMGVLGVLLAYFIYSLWWLLWI